MRKLPQQIDGGGQRKLRGAQTRNEISAANAAALFQRFQHVVNGAESAGDVLCTNGFTRENAVAIEKLQGKGMAGFSVRWASLTSLS